jgi:hypothetical protein
MAPRRTGKWIWAGRVLAIASIGGLSVYLVTAGTTRANLIAAPTAVVIALASLLAPYLLPVYSTLSPGPASPSRSDETPGAATVIIADHGSVAAQYIRDVTMNPPPSGPDSP